MLKKKSNYDLNRKEYERVKKMDHSQMQQWASDIFTKGQQSMEVAPVQQLPEDAMERLLNIKGIGEAKADMILDALQ